jgi:alpha/beta superfamily hydrolase
MIAPAPESCRITSSNGSALEGRYVAGSGSTGGAVVAPPHPLYGGSIDNPVVVATAAGLRQASIATLTFNYRGVERSDGTTTDSLEAAVNDYAATLTELATRTPGPYLAAGYSFGAGVALLTARDDPRVTGVVLVAPPVRLLRSDDLRAFSGPIMVVVGDDDEYAPLPELTPILAARPDLALMVIPGADHFFHFGGLTQLDQHIAAQVRSWL